MMIVLNILILNLKFLKSNYKLMKTNLKPKGLADFVINSLFNPVKILREEKRKTMILGRTFLFLDF